MAPPNNAPAANKAAAKPPAAAPVAKASDPRMDAAAAASDDPANTPATGEDVLRNGTETAEQAEQNDVEEHSEAAENATDAARDNDQTNVKPKAATLAPVDNKVGGNPDAPPKYEAPKPPSDPVDADKIEAADRVTVVSPRAFRLQYEPGKYATFRAGVQTIPREFLSHQYVVDNGVKEYKG